MKTDAYNPRFVLFSLARLCLRKKDIALISAFLRDDISAGNKKHTDIFRNELISSAAAEGICGFFHYHLRHSDSFALPEKILRHLEKEYRKTEGNTLTRMAEAAVISERCRAAGIGILGIQGISVLRLYRHPGLRPMGDTDLMVKAVHKEKLEHILTDAGYAPVFPYPDLWRKKNLLLDVHSHIMNLDRIPARAFIFPENLESMWQRAVPFFPKNNETRTGLLCPDPFDNFTALSAHALKHGYSRLIWLTDLHELARSWGNSEHAWQELLHRARFWQQERVVLYALLLTEKIFGLPVPLWLKERLEGRKPITLPEKICLNAVMQGICATDMSMILWLCNIRGMRQKIRFAKANLFPKQEVMRQVFPHRSSRNRYGNYLWRIRDILLRNLRILWKIRRKKRRTPAGNAASRPLHPP